MSTPLWRLEKSLARLEMGELSASVDVACPQKGIFAVSAHRVDLSRWRLLAAHTLGERAAPDACEDVVDSYVRGDDLVATYRETEARHVRPQVYWRRLALEASDAVAVGFELILSMQTSLLDSDPGLLCRSEISGASVRQLVDPEKGCFEARPVAETPCDVGSAAGSGAFLFRMDGAPWSYLQLTLPADFDQAALHREAAPERIVLSQRLFPEHLEKGVIRRVRVRGLFLPQGQDEELARAIYQQWIDEEPPLTV
jgi:hypothetical protein